MVRDFCGERQSRGEDARSAQDALIGDQRGRPYGEPGDEGAACGDGGKILSFYPRFTLAELERECAEALAAWVSSDDLVRSVLEAARREPKAQPEGADASPCLTHDDLVALGRGLLSGREAVGAARHLRACPRCAELATDPALQDQIEAARGQDDKLLERAWSGLRLVESERSLENIVPQFRIFLWDMLRIHWAGASAETAAAINAIMIGAFIIGGSSLAFPSALARSVVLAAFVLAAYLVHVHRRVRTWYADQLIPSLDAVFFRGPVPPLSAGEESRRKEIAMAGYQDLAVYLPRLGVAYYAITSILIVSGTALALPPETDPSQVLLSLLAVPGLSVLMGVAMNYGLFRIRFDQVNMDALYPATTPETAWKQGYVTNAFTSLTRRCNLADVSPFHILNILQWVILYLSAAAALVGLAVFDVPAVRLVLAILLLLTLTASVACATACYVARHRRVLVSRAPELEVVVRLADAMGALHTVELSTSPEIEHEQLSRIVELARTGKTGVRIRRVSGETVEIPARRYS